MPGAWLANEAAADGFSARCPFAGGFAGCHGHGHRESTGTLHGRLLRRNVEWRRTRLCSAHQWRCRQSGVVKLRTMRAWVFSVLLWLVPIKLHSFSNVVRAPRPLLHAHKPCPHAPHSARAPHRAPRTQIVPQAQSRPDFPSRALFWLRMAENVALSVALWVYTPTAAVRPPSPPGPTPDQ